MTSFIKYQIKCLCVGLAISVAFSMCIAAVVYGIQAIEAKKTSGQKYAQTLTEYYTEQGIDYDTEY